MFPYFWNGNNTNTPYGAIAPGFFSRDLGLGDLPEEVQEALELHRNEMHSEEDIRHFIDGLNMRK